VPRIEPETARPVRFDRRKEVAAAVHRRSVRARAPLR
jgi:hypothetical protein